MTVERDEHRLYDLCSRFRGAIDLALNNGVFEEDKRFRKFPTNCCGPASDLLGQFLADEGIETWYVCGTFYSDWEDPYEDPCDRQSHAWLTNVNPLANREHIIMDVTGDQFEANGRFGNYGLPVYVGGMDAFHAMFEYGVCDVRVCTGCHREDGTEEPWRSGLFEQITRYL